MEAEDVTKKRGRCLKFELPVGVTVGDAIHMGGGVFVLDPAPPFPRGATMGVVLETLSTERQSEHKIQAEFVDWPFKADEAVYRGKSAGAKRIEASAKDGVLSVSLRDTRASLALFAKEQWKHLGDLRIDGDFTVSGDVTLTYDERAEHLEGWFNEPDTADPEQMAEFYMAEADRLSQLLLKGAPEYEALPEAKKMDVMWRVSHCRSRAADIRRKLAAK